MEFKAKYIWLRVSEVPHVEGSLAFIFLGKCITCANACSCGSLDIFVPKLLMENEEYVW